MKNPPLVQLVFMAPFVSKQRNKCSFHGAHELFTRDAAHVKLYAKLRRTDWEKENALQSIFQRLTGVFGAEDLKDLPYLSHFIAKQEVLSGSGAYGFKWTELQLNYHKAPSKNTTEVQSRWNNCKMATDPFRFLRIV